MTATLQEMVEECKGKHAIRIPGRIKEWYCPILFPGFNDGMAECKSTMGECVRDIGYDYSRLRKVYLCLNHEE